ncbi:MAG: flavodoxin [bacterium]|nr:flavodoxin [bacterium]
MKLCIRYFTKSKKGNTKKLSDFISNRLNLEALDVSFDLEEDVDYLILVNALYANNIDKEVKTFLENNKERISNVVNVCSSASGKSTYKKVKKECDRLGINIIDDEYHTKASWIFINKDRPNEDDFNRLAIFIDNIKEKSDLNG